MILALQELGAGKQATTKGREECCNKPMSKVHRFRKGRSRDCWSLCWLFSQLDNWPQARDPGPQSEFSLPGSTKHLRSQLAQCKQRYQDLQEKLLISEATVFAQANQLEKYRVMLSKS